MQSPLQLLFMWVKQLVLLIVGPSSLSLPSALLLRWHQLLASSVLTRQRGYLALLALTFWLAGSGMVVAQLVTNTNTSATFPTIQAAINDAGTLNGHTLQVAVGTYTGLVDVTKSLTILGANAGITGAGSRVAESIITGGGTTDAIAVRASNVVINGFRLENTGGNLYGGVGVGFGSNPSSVTVVNNVITNNIIGISGNNTGGNILIANNLFDGNNKPGAAGGAAFYVDNATNGFTLLGNVIRNHTQNSPIILGATSLGTHQNFLFAQNTIESSNTAAGSMLYITSLTNGTFTQNTLNGSGIRSLKLAGGNANISVTNNFISFSSTLAGVVLSDDGFGANTDVSVNNNNFVGSGGLAIENQTGVTVNATCNWYGTVSNINTFVSGPVTFMPFSSDGTDNDGSTPGFQPVPNSCSCLTPAFEFTITAGDQTAVASSTTVSGRSVSLTICDGTPVVLSQPISNGVAGYLIGYINANNPNNNSDAFPKPFELNQFTSYSQSLGDPAQSGLFALTLAAYNDADGTTGYQPGDCLSELILVNVTIVPNPAIVTQPPMASVVCEGTTVVASVSATNVGSYQWYKDGVAVPGQTSATLTLGGVVPAQAGSYALVVGNCSSLTTSAFELTVNPAPTVTLIFNNSATVMGTGIPTITVPPGPNQVFQVLEGTNYERIIVLDRINGYEIRQVDKNTTGVFLINQRGLFTIIVTNGNGCSRTVQGILANPANQ